MCVKDLFFANPVTIIRSYTIMYYNGETANLQIMIIMIDM